MEAKFAVRVNFHYSGAELSQNYVFIELNTLNFNMLYLC